jgi:hypothetical protein
MVQHIEVNEDGGSLSLNGQRTKEIKKTRRTVILGNSALTIPASPDNTVPPLTPPLSERASGDVEELLSPEKEEHYECVDLSSDEGEEWSQETPIDDPERV